LKVITLETDTLKTDTLETDTLETDTLETDTLETDTLETDTLETDNSNVIILLEVILLYEQEEFCYQEYLTDVCIVVYKNIILITIVE